MEFVLCCAVPRRSFFGLPSTCQSGVVWRWYHGSRCSIAVPIIILESYSSSKILPKGMNGIGGTLAVYGPCVWAWLLKYAWGRPELLNGFWFWGCCGAWEALVPGVSEPEAGAVFWSLPGPAGAWLGFRVPSSAAPPASAKTHADHQILSLYLYGYAFEIIIGPIEKLNDLKVVP